MKKIKNILKSKKPNNKQINKKMNLEINFLICKMGS